MFVFIIFYGYYFLSTGGSIFLIYYFLGYSAGIIFWDFFKSYFLGEAATTFLVVYLKLIYPFFLSSFHYFFNTIFLSPLYFKSYKLNF